MCDLLLSDLEDLATSDILDNDKYSRLVDFITKSCKSKRASSDNLARARNSIAKVRVAETKKKLVSAINMLKFIGDKVSSESVSEMAKVSITTAKKYAEEYGY